MKLPVIAITWGLATVWVPGVMSGEGPWEVNLIVRAIAQSTFIAGLTIPFRCARLADRPSGNEYRAPAHRAAKAADDCTLAHSVERLFFHGGWECPCTDDCRRMCHSLGHLRSFCSRRVACTASSLMGASLFKALLSFSTKCSRKWRFSLEL